MRILLGMYLLSSLLFAKRSTIFIYAAAACSVDLYDQIFFDFKIFYLTWPMFFSDSFAEEAAFLWLTGLTLIAWVMGVCCIFPLWLLFWRSHFLYYFYMIPVSAAACSNALFLT